MPDITYNNAITVSTATGFTNFHWNGFKWSLDAKVADRVNEYGTTINKKYRDHVLKVTLESAVFPAGSSIPVKGQIVVLTGITVPTIVEATGVATGGFAATGTATAAFLVESSSGEQSDGDNEKCTLTLERYLVSGYPVAPT